MNAFIEEMGPAPGLAPGSIYLPSPSSLSLHPYTTSIPSPSAHRQSRLVPYPRSDASKHPPTRPFSPLRPSAQHGRRIPHHIRQPDHLGLPDLRAHAHLLEQPTTPLPPQPGPPRTHIPSRSGDVDAFAGKRVVGVVPAGTDIEQARQLGGRGRWRLHRRRERCSSLSILFSPPARRMPCDKGILGLTRYSAVSSMQNASNTSSISGPPPKPASTAVPPPRASSTPNSPSPPHPPTPHRTDPRTRS